MESRNTSSAWVVEIYHPSAKVLDGEVIDHLDQEGVHGEEVIGHPLVKELVGVVIDHP
jgi:hypothetical protein